MNVCLLKDGLCRNYWPNASKGILLQTWQFGEWSLECLDVNGKWSIRRLETLPSVRWAHIWEWGNRGKYWRITSVLWRKEKFARWQSILMKCDTLKHAQSDVTVKFNNFYYPQTPFTNLSPSSFPPLYFFLEKKFASLQNTKERERDGNNLSEANLPNEWKGSLSFFHRNAAC